MSFQNHKGRPGLTGGSLPRNNMTQLFLILKGSSTSGNYGHSGRPGHQGGSVSQSMSFSSSKEADSWAEKNMDVKELENDEYRTLVAYKAGMSRVINAKLRGLTKVDGQPVKNITDEQLDSFTKKLDSAFSKSKAPETLSVYRYIGSGASIDFSKLKEGDSFTDPGYSSTTLVRAKAKGITKGKGLLEIEIPKGFPAIYCEPFRNETYVKKSESEILLPKDVKFTIKKVNNKTNPPTVIVSISR